MSKKRERYMTVMNTVTLDAWNNCERVSPAPVDVNKDGDHGADPVGDGTFRMVPSGDVVDRTERDKRLGK